MSRWNCKTTKRHALSALRLADFKAFVARCKGTLRKHGGTVRYAAKELGVDERTLWNWIKKHPELRVS